MIRRIDAQVADFADVRWLEVNGRKTPHLLGLTLFGNASRHVY